MRATDAARGAAAGVAASAFLTVVAGCQQTVVFEQTHDGGDALPVNPGDSCTSVQMPVVLQYVVESPEVILALDRSTAMGAPFGSNTQIEAALDALGGVVTKYDPVVSFDYVEFPGPDFSCSQSNGCCASQVSPTPDSRSFQYAAHRCDSPSAGCPLSSERPTGAALNSCAEFFAQSNSGGGKRYVLLVTDGAPTCGSGSGGGGCPENAIVNNLRNARPEIKTAVVVLGNIADDQCLSQIGNTGGAGSNPPFYASATTPEGLTATLATVVGTMAAAACNLDLPGPPDYPAQVTVLLGTAVVPQGGSDGWQFDNTRTRIMLMGAACQAFLDNPASLGLLGCTNTRH